MEISKKFPIPMPNRFKFIVFYFPMAFLLNVANANEECIPEVKRDSIFRIYVEPSLDSLIPYIYKSLPCDVNALPRQVSKKNNSLAIGALMFNKADVAFINRPFTALETAPYAHQYAGDMMRAPFTVTIGYFNELPVIVSFNKRPDTAPSKTIELMLKKILSNEGQKSISEIQHFQTLNSTSLENEKNKLDFPHINFDDQIKPYIFSKHFQGKISSIGSDGMKSIVDTWFEDFHKQQNDVVQGERWEHLGTLNGYHALLNEVTDLAPMGRELWPEELDAFNKALPGKKLLEFRVAHGGFNTQQRTTVQAIFVNRSNPINTISLDDLKKIWMNPPQITRWGQLGAKGEWEDKPIELFSPPLASPNARSFQSSILNWGSFNKSTIENPVSVTSEKISAVQGSMGFGGFEDMGQHATIKAIAVSKTRQSASVIGSIDTVANRTYPLSRYMYIRLAIAKDSVIEPHIKEFLRYILSKSAQEKLLYSGYFPLTHTEIQHELEKLQD